jgi:thymidylate synthase (FAD)
MNIVKPYAKMINFFHDGRVVDFTWEDGILLLKKCEWIGRISHRSEDAVTEDSWKRVLQAAVVDKGDWSITEHASVTVDFTVDRGITHELVIHRLCAITQESTRFVNYEKKMPASFVRPLFEGDIPNILEVEWYHSIEEAEGTYKRLVQLGCKPQIARSVFPNALASRIVFTCNLREWRHIFIVGTTKEAHPQMREVMIPLLEEFKEKIPLLYDDIIPNDSRSHSMEKKR